MVELWLSLITEVAVNWIFPMTVVLGSIVAILIIGSYWSKQGEERLLLQCAFAAIALHLLLFVTAYQLPRVAPTPFPSREIRVAVELRGSEEEKPVETLSEHRAPLGETSKIETIEAAPAELSIEPTRPEVAMETMELPEVAQKQEELVPTLENDPLLPNASSTAAPDNEAALAETAPVRPTEEISRTPEQNEIARAEIKSDVNEALPPIDPARPEPAPAFAPDELSAPPIDAISAPESKSTSEESAPVRPTEVLTRQETDAAPARDALAPTTIMAPDLPIATDRMQPEIELPPAEPTAPPIDSVEAPAARSTAVESKPVRPLETMSRDTNSETAVRAESNSAEPFTPELPAPSLPAPELPINEEAIVFAPPAALPSATVDAPEVKPSAVPTEKRVPTERVQRNGITIPADSPKRESTDTIVTPPAPVIPSPIPNPIDVGIPSQSPERSSLPTIGETIQPPTPARSMNSSERKLLPSPDSMKVDRTTETPIRRPSKTSITTPEAPALPRSPAMTDMPARPGIDAPLPIPSTLSGANTAVSPSAPTSAAIVPKRFNLDVAMARPEQRVERRSTMPSDDTSKLNLKELVPEQSTPPAPVEASINFWDNRLAPNRLAIVYRHGGSDETERAVNSALDWLAAHQSPDGRWDSDGFDAACPRGDRCDGHAIERESDTGLTGLALLAFLGAGHTHLETTKHRETVRRGLSWLIRVQRPDGDLQNGGRIYCHSMATLALTEAYAMTKDQRLHAPAQRAILWLAAAQHPETGGWRYAPRETGDTSVYGWAVLSLRSARQAKLDVPEQTWLLAKRWIPSISTGAHGGLACYRPGYPPSHAMTAEALFCRQVLGDKIDDKLMNEAADYVAARLPDSSDYHIYYWYYGTLSLFQTGGSRWDRWNQRLTATLLETQRKTGHAKGSWEPQTPFGVDGGRIFSTAVSAMCLEVYYRYLPLYEQAKRDNQ